MGSDTKEARGRESGQERGHGQKESRGRRPTATGRETGGPATVGMLRVKHLIE